MLLTLAFALLATAPSGPDEIWKKGAQRPFRGTVVSEDSQVVKYRVSGQNLEIPSSQVDRIDYEDAPEPFTRAQELLALGEFENAAASFQLAGQSRSRGNWVQVHALFGLGMTYYLWGASDGARYRSAADTFDQLLTDRPDCRFLPEALKRWGLALQNAGDAAAAVPVFERLQKESEEKKLGLAWEAEARILKADALAAQGDGAAEAAYREAGTFAQSNAAQQEDGDLQRQLLSIAGRAQLSQGTALLKAGKHDEARRFFEQVAGSSDSSPEVKAGAGNGLGEVLLAEGRARDALQEFARVRVHHYLVQEETARATYYLGLCCLELKDAEPNSKGKAREYFSEVVERYPESKWADQARSQL